MQSQVSGTTESERTTLLKRIHILESNELTESTHLTLRDLKLRYNELGEADNPFIQCSNHLEYLPNEIWTLVFLRAIEDDGLDILPLMQACQRWTSIIVSEPRLWTSIYIRGYVEYLELAYSAL
jgi:hypothetical protein